MCETLLTPELTMSLSMALSLALARFEYKLRKQQKYTKKNFGGAVVKAKSQPVFCTPRECRKILKFLTHAY